MCIGKNITWCWRYKTKFKRRCRTKDVETSRGDSELQKKIWNRTYAFWRRNRISHLWNIPDSGTQLYSKWTRSILCQLRLCAHNWCSKRIVQMEKLKHQHSIIINGCESFAKTCFSNDASKHQMSKFRLRSFFLSNYKGLRLLQRWMMAFPV